MGDVTITTSCLTGTRAKAILDALWDKVLDADAAIPSEYIEDRTKLMCLVGKPVVFSIKYGLVI